MSHFGTKISCWLLRNVQLTGRDITIIVVLKLSLKSLADISLRYLFLRFRHVVFRLLFPQSITVLNVSSWTVHSLSIQLHIESSLQRLLFMQTRGCCATIWIRYCRFIIVASYFFISTCHLMSNVCLMDQIS